MELGPNEIRVLSLNRRMVLAMARDQGTEAEWLETFRAADEHQARQAAMERAARPVDVGALELDTKYEIMMRGNAGVRA